MMPGNAGGGRRPHFGRVFEGVKESSSKEIGVSLEKPGKIRELQRKLYLKAKQEPQYRFYLLYDKVYRMDVLEHAYRLAKANKGVPGVDGETFEDIERRGVEQWIAEIREDLREKRYKPQAVRRVMIPKANGGERPLGIPTIRDRVVQTAVKLIIEPIFEADFEDCSYGYRPNRSAQEAVKAVHAGLCEGYTEVIDADLSKYFDTIPHRELMYAVARRMSDKHMLHLIKMWLKVPVHETDEHGTTRISGGKKTKQGTPQGGVISPLLANVYLNRLHRAWRERKKGEEYAARIIAYADDFVVLSKGRARQALQWIEWAVNKLGLKLNRAKTSIKNAWQEHFEFLGYSFGKEVYTKDGHYYLGARASKKSVARLRDKLRSILTPANNAPWEEVRDQVNRILQGWANYFSCGSRFKPYRAVDNFVYHRVRGFLCRRHKVASQGGTRFPDSVVFGTLGVLRLRTVQLGALV
jgi:RNA-directed DNA polymerase